MIRIKDSSDRESITLGFVVIAFLAITGKYIGAVFGYGTDVSVTEYGTGFAAILAVWLGREWIKKE